MNERRGYLFPVLMMIAGLLCLLMAALVAGCTPANKRPDLPEATLAEHTETVRQVYVQIDQSLTAHPTEIPTGEKPSDAPQVAKARGGLLLQCWAQLDAIGEIQGTELKPKGRAP